MPVAEGHRLWLAAERIKILSDRLIGFGPFGMGLDGLLAFVPVAGTAYSLGAGALLVREAVLAGASSWTITRMSLYVGFRTAASVVPLIGSLVDIGFRGHLMAAKALQKDIGRRCGQPDKAAIDVIRRHPFRFRPAGADAPQIA
ncbi:MAG: DUF4112 domain-containing protein [Caulobacterales bacterium]